MSSGGYASRMNLEDLPSAERIKSMTTRDFKVWENRCRRMAQRQLLTLRRSRRRDPNAWDYGQYSLVDRDDNVVAAGALQEIHAYLLKRPR
jgi:hypothetical protein